MPACESLVRQKGVAVIGKSRVEQPEVLMETDTIPQRFAEPSEGLSRIIVANQADGP